MSLMDNCHEETDRTMKKMIDPKNNTKEPGYAKLGFFLVISRNIFMMSKTIN